MCDSLKKVFWCFNEQDKVRKKSMQQLEVHPDDIHIDISNPMLKYKAAKYTYHYGLLWLLPMSILLTILGNTDKLGRPETESGRLAISVIVIFVLFAIIVICLSVSIGYYWRSKAKQPGLLQLKSSISLGSIGSINDLFDIPNPMLNQTSEPAIYEVYTLDRYYYGIILIFYFIYTALNILVTEIGFYLIDETICYNRETLSPKMIAKCVVNQSNFAKVYIIIICVMVTGTSYFEVSTNCKIRTETIKNSVLGFNNLDENEAKQQISACAKIQEIDERIQDKLKKWKKSKSLNERKGEIVGLFICCAVLQIFVVGILRNSVFGSEVPFGAKIFCLWMNICDSTMLAVFLVCVTSAITHFSFPTLIMNELSQQINCRTVGELIKWWELRKCYLFCIIDIHAAGISGMILSTLVGDMAGIITFLGFYYADQQETALLLLLVILIVFAFSATFTAVGYAVNFHNNQLNHVQMINKEKLKLLSDKNTFKDKIIEGIEFDVKENSHPFNVLGVRLTSTFRLFLQSTAATIALAFVFSG